MQKWYDQYNKRNNFKENARKQISEKLEKAIISETNMELDYLVCELLKNLDNVWDNEVSNYSFGDSSNNVQKKIIETYKSQTLEDQYTTFTKDLSKNDNPQNIANGVTIGEGTLISWIELLQKYYEAEVEKITYYFEKDVFKKFVGAFDELKKIENLLKDIKNKFENKKNNITSTLEKLDSAETIVKQHISTLNKL